MFYSHKMRLCLGLPDRMLLTFTRGLPVILTPHIRVGTEWDISVDAACTRWGIDVEYLDLLCEKLIPRKRNPYLPNTRGPRKWTSRELDQSMAARLYRLRLP
mgnify:CR=1 FL=1